jgi:hypothetical protein
MAYSFYDGVRRVEEICKVFPNLPNSISFVHRGKDIGLILPDNYDYIKLLITVADCFYEWEMLDYIADN